MTPAVAASVRKSGACSVVINNTFQLAPWADMLYAADSAWWAHHAQTALRFAGLKVTAHDAVPYRQVLSLRNADRGQDKSGYEPDPSAVRTNGNGGATGVHIAAHAGAARILLCGFNMHGDGEHWHGRHPAPLRSTGEHTYRKWVRWFAHLASDLQARGIELLNCTPGGALTCCPYVELEEALAPRPVPVQ